MENQYIFEIGSIKRKIVADFSPDDMDKIFYLIKEKYDHLREVYPNLRENIILAYLSLDLATDLYTTKEALRGLEKRLDKALKESDERTNRGI